MRLRLLILLLLVAALTGCGGGSDEVPADAVAVVDGQKVSRSDYDAVLVQVKKTYENEKQEFPKAGSQQFQTLKNQVVQFLVQRVQFEQEAAALDIEITDKQVDARLEQVVKQYFGGDRRKLEAQLKEQGSSERQVRGDIRAQIVSEKIFAEVTGKVSVTDKQVEDYYAKNTSQYSQPESREVRHILVKTRAKADDIYDELNAGADFTALAKRFSEDTGSKANGGKLTISKGQTVAPFDQTAFLLKTNEISKPVKTQFGFHIIQPLGEVKPAKVTPLKEVQDSIRQQLAQTKKNETMTKWTDDVNEKYEDKVSYAVGFKPPPAKSTTAATEGETTR